VSPKKSATQLISRDLKPVMFRKQHGARKRVSVLAADPDNPTRTHQSFKDECDINGIVKKAQSTGVLPSLIKENPQYGDFSDPLDYQQSLNVIIRANEQFDALPSHVRARFANDPQNFLMFTADPKNLPEMVKMGLATYIPNDSNDTDQKAQAKTPTSDKKPAEKEAK
jgi:phage internal scaffolding protein